MNENNENDYLNDVFEGLTNDGDERTSGIPSGFSRLDDLTGGWQESDLIVIGSRPSMGKTSLALSIAEHAAVDLEPPTGTLVFSLEMSGTQVAQRLISSRAQFNLNEVRPDGIGEKEQRRLRKAAGEIHGSPLYIDDTPRLSVDEITDKSRRFQEKRGVGLVVVDYLQLLQSPGSSFPSGATREEELAHMTRGLKALAKEMDVPVIVLSGLNRKVENRGGTKRPQLTDLRGSGSIEQDADVVAFVYRAERYGITLDKQGNSTEGVAEIIVAKQRSGPIGSVELAFKKQYGRFEPLSEIDRSPSDQDSGSGSSFEDDPPF